MKPRFQFIIMNRRSTENLVEDLLDEFEYEVQIPYLLYRNASQEVNGIWFYNSQECEEVAKLFSRILGAYSKNMPKRKVFTPQVDEIQELEAIPSSATVGGSLGSPPAPLTPGGMENPLEQFSSNALHLNACDPVSPSMGMRTIVPIHSSPVHPTAEKAFSQVLAMSSPSLQASSPPLSPPLPPVSSSKQSSGERLINNNNSNISTSMMLEVPLKPCFFVPPPLPSLQMPTLPPLVVLQPSIGAPLLQPFPPPAPSSSLAHSNAALNRPSVSRDGVHRALIRLVQNERFVDMVYEEMLRTHRQPV